MHGYPPSFFASSSQLAVWFSNLTVLVIQPSSLTFLGPSVAGLEHVIPDHYGLFNPSLARMTDDKYLVVARVSNWNYCPSSWNGDWNSTPQSLSEISLQR
mmetsp:Transcript_75329/g.201232  ORF Transcript_75329/g.201232 Transcript_75329/m.201232 type:complete len:100 (+) Transcript_75329:267-566(+)